MAALITPALADWNPGDPHKMHFPQLPDPNGWDIDIVPGNAAADDWKCSETGPVRDIHFWYSWERDVVGQIGLVFVDIYSNAVDPNGLSHPGNLLWQRTFSPDQFTTRWYGDGNQDFWDAGGGPLPNDHVNYYQLNIENIQDPFVQQADKIYWLSLSVAVADPVGTHIGWKTSTDHFMDVAMHNSIGTGGQKPWAPLFDPFTGIRLDMAFVITPEPGSALLLGLGALALMRRRR